MTVIILPGSSLRNQALIQEAKNKYADIIALRWNHWDGEENRLDDYKRVLETLQKHPQASVIAKSYGGALIMQALTQQEISNNPITILGALPQAYNKPTINTQKIDARIHIIQNEQDPHGSYQEVTKHFSNVTCIKNNDTHSYELPTGHTRENDL